MFSKAKIAELTARFSNVNVESITDAKLQAKARKLKAKQLGFTLLELLVVVAILAAVAGTATLALKDTDARAAAAAHVAMMDELNKGIRTFAKLNKNQFPNNFDSLVTNNANPALISTIANESIAVQALPAGAAAVMEAQGMTTHMVIDETRYMVDSTPDGKSLCDADGVKTIIDSRKNAVVPGEIFMVGATDGTTAGTETAPYDAGGCGVQETYDDGVEVAVWTSETSRIYGTDKGTFTAGGTPSGSKNGTPVLLTVGLGPSSDLFDANKLGGMTTVPVYRHVSGSDYNRFQALFEIGKMESSGTEVGDKFVEPEQIELIAIVDGAGDTKEEELGEWDGSRNTI